ncbi:MAG: dTDP-4-dehydrorhamnose 3,5-epimerase [Bacteroidetes bacterium]|nr:dTDP-4-dehydrorhamnose 3,5-epimerase [Bacteroidota bacterium]
MIVTKTEFPDLFIIEPQVYGDSRGFFYESYNQASLEKFDIHYNFRQDNHSLSGFGVLRGLHYQRGVYAQTKLVRCVSGKVLDIVVDLRAGSPTYLKHFAIELNAENHKQLLIPKGFAHGFVVLSETAEFLYKCDNFYNKESEGGIHFLDKELGIDWGLQPDQYIVSEKDQLNPSIKEAAFDFPFDQFTAKKLYGA